MEVFSQEGLTLTVVEPDAHTIQVVWTGKSTSRDPAKLLLPWFHPLIEKAVTAHALLELHF